MANSVDSDQTAPIGAVRSRSTLFASILNSSVLFSNYLQQTNSADDIFRCIFFCALRVKRYKLLASKQSHIHFDLRNEPRHEITNDVVCATSKASDQSVHTHSLIRAFASRLNTL